MISRSAAGRPGLSGRITSETGKKGIVTVEGNVVSLSQEAILGIEPSEDKVPYRFLLSNRRPLPRTQESQGSTTELHEMGIQFEDESKTTIIGMAGCIMSYSEQRIAATQRNYVKPVPGSSKAFTPLYGISTITIGVPCERYKNIADRLYKQFRIRPDIDQEVVQNGYVWVDASINMPKVPEHHPDSEEFTNEYETQVSYYQGGDLYAVGPVYSCCRDFKRSFKVVFFGTMRLKKTVTDPKTPAAFKLGMTMQTVQLYDLSDINAPSNTEKAGPGLYASSLPATPALLALIEDPGDQVEEPGHEGHHAEDAGAYQADQDDGTVYADEGDFEDHGNAHPEYE